MKNASQVLVFPARYRTCSQRCADAVVRAVQYGQDGETALEMAEDEDTVKCFLDAGIKLSDIVTDEVVIAFVPEMGLCCTRVWERATEREQEYMVCRRAWQDTTERADTHGCCWDICIHAVIDVIRHQVCDWNDGAGRSVTRGRH